MTATAKMNLLGVGPTNDPAWLAVAISAISGIGLAIFAFFQRRDSNRTKDRRGQRISNAQTRAAQAQRIQDLENAFDEQLAEWKESQRTITILTAELATLRGEVKRLESVEAKNEELMAVTNNLRDENRRLNSEVTILRVSNQTLSEVNQSLTTQLSTFGISPAPRTQQPNQ